MSTREIAQRIAKRFIGSGDNVELRRERCASAISDALTKAIADERARFIRVLGAKEVEDLAHHAIGVWQAFEESHLFNNTAENGQKIRDAVEDARQIAATAAAIRRDSTGEEGS
jgi:hypothetical protein